MSIHRILRFALLAGAIGLLSLHLPGWPCSRASAADAPAHQVIVCYFHRTVRCPTCKMVGSYIQESVQAAFPEQVKDGSVKLFMIDFQDPKNQQYAQAYKVSGPMMVVLDVRDGKVAAWKPAPKVWSLLAKKAEFFEYVQAEVQDYLDAEPTAP